VFYELISTHLALKGLKHFPMLQMHLRMGLELWKSHNLTLMYEEVCKDSLYRYSVMLVLNCQVALVFNKM